MFVIAMLLALSDSAEPPVAKLTCQIVNKPGSSEQVQFDLQNLTDTAITLHATGYTLAWMVSVKNEDGTFTSKEHNWCGTCSPYRTITIPPGKSVTWSRDAETLRKKYGTEIRFMMAGVRLTEPKKRLYSVTGDIVLNDSSD